MAHLRRGRDSGEATDISTQGDAILDEQTMDALLGIRDEETISEESLGTPTWDADLDEGGGAELTGGPLADSFTRRVDDIWRQLRYREAAFGDKWPFNIDQVTRALTLKSDLTSAQRVYIFFLLSSRCGTNRNQLPIP